LGWVSVSGGGKDKPSPWRIKNVKSVEACSCSDCCFNWFSLGIELASGQIHIDRDTAIDALGYRLPACRCIVDNHRLHTKSKLVAKPQDALPMAITGILLIFGFNVLTAIGQVLMETSKAAIIAFTMPSLTAGLATIFLNE